jgi:hypothetical protein
VRVLVSSGQETRHAWTLASGCLARWRKGHVTDVLFCTLDLDEVSPGLLGVWLREVVFLWNVSL